MSGYFPHMQEMEQNKKIQQQTELFDCLQMNQIWSTHAHTDSYLLSSNCSFVANRFYSNFKFDC